TMWHSTYTIFFFSSRRRHTRSKRDWSSDVCSSDLPARIHAFNPDARLIYLMRDPVERALSHYWYFVADGREDRDVVTAVRRTERSEERRVGKEGGAGWGADAGTQSKS